MDPLDISILLVALLVSWHLSLLAFSNKLNLFIQSMNDNFHFYCSYRLWIIRVLVHLIASLFFAF